MTSKKQLKQAQAERMLAEQEKMTPKSWCMLIFGILAASIVRAVSIQIFITPNNFAPGGITGLATILEHYTHLNAGIFLAGFNIPLLVVAWIFINKRFAIISGISIILSAVWMYLLEWLVSKGWFFSYDAAALGADMILAAIAGGILGGVGIAVMYKLGGSCGGTDIIAVIIQKKFSATNVTWFVFMLDSTVVVASAFVYGSLTPVLLAFVEMFASSKVVETILEGFKSALKIEIITNQAEELSAEIMRKLRRGVTCMPAKGMYTGEERAMLVCILRKRQLSPFREILKQFPDSFAYISNTSEVLGQGFSTKVKAAQPKKELAEAAATSDTAPPESTAEMTSSVNTEVQTETKE